MIWIRNWLGLLWICFVLYVCFLTVCRLVLVFFKCMINLTSFLFKSRFISSLLFFHLFFTQFFFFWFSSFSHTKRLRLVGYFVCLFRFLSWNYRVIIHNFITFLPGPKYSQCSSFIPLLTPFYILFWNLRCFLPIVLLVIYFNNYQWAECPRTTLAGFFLGGVHWQWPWTSLRIDSRVLGDVLYSVMFLFWYLFLFLCNILA